MDSFDIDFDNDTEIADKKQLFNMIQMAIKTLKNHNADQFERNWVAASLGDALADNEDLF